MNLTEKMTEEINVFLKAVGEAELPVFQEKSEWNLLRKVKAAYTVRLLEKMPQYKTFPAEKIPDMFLQALGNREAELAAAKGNG